MSYAYDEELMLAGIRAFKARRWISRRKLGCQVHGESDMRPAANGYRLCRICQAAHSRSNYAKNRERIKAQKREYRRRKRALSEAKAA